MRPPRTSLRCLVFPCFFEGWEWAVLLGREEISNAVLGSCGRGKVMSTPEQSGPEEKETRGWSSPSSSSIHPLTFSERIGGSVRGEKDGITPVIDGLLVTQFP